jgi:biopolymer transport protein TolR
VYVRGDRHVDYGRVVDAMVTVQTAGVARVGLITDPAEAGL